MKKLKSDHITIETTNFCPAKCIICPREKYEHPLMFMDMDLFEKIIDDAAQYNISVLDLCGFGEPFTDSLLFERCEYAKKKIPNLKIYVSTTGYLMHRSTHYNVCKYIDILKLSVYGMTKEVYEKSHGGIKFEKSFANIFSLLNRKDKPHIIGLMVLNDINEHQMREWIAFWEPLCDEVMVWTPHNWAGLRNYREVDHTAQRSCGRPFNGPLYIHVDGTVSPCCWDINRKIKIGDMNTDTIYNVLHSDAFQKLQKAHANNNFKDYLCFNCEQTNNTPGACVYSNNNAKPGVLTATKGELCE